MFKRTWPPPFLTNVSKIRLIAVGLVLAGAATSLGGFYQLQALMKTEYEFRPVAEQRGSDRAELGSIYIDVSGAVAKPGLVELPAGSRLAAAIEQAGGFSPDADKYYIASRLNTSSFVQDGDKVFIPSVNDVPSNPTADSTGAAGSLLAEPSLISINQASAKELQQLPQIGAKRAEDIAAGRPYQSTNELLTKKIVTENIFNDIKSLISL